MLLDELFEPYELEDDIEEVTYKFDSKESIDKFLASPLSYKEKIEILNEEKKKCSNMMKKIIEHKLISFKHSRKYIDKMEDNKKSAVVDAIWQTPISLVSVGGFITTTKGFISSCLKNGHITANAWLFSGGMLATGVIAAFLGGAAIENIKESISYEKEIKSYNRMLTRKTI